MSLYRKYLKFTFVVFCLFVAQCDRSKKGPVVARVGKSTLSLETLKNSIPNEYSSEITKEQNINYVKQWIDRELLYQEALNQKIDKDPLIKQRLEKMKVDLLAAEMLNRLSMKVQSENISDSEIENYYKQNKNQFIRDHDLVKYVDISVENVNEAWEVCRSVNKNNFISVALQHSKNSSFDSTNIPYISFEMVPSEIREALTSLNLKSISTPIKSPSGYHIVYLIDKLRKGEVCDLQEVQKEIVNQLMTINQKTMVEKELSNLRIKNRVEFNLNIVSDSLKDNTD